ncbi:MAG: zinc ABC transporter substrate-binding protein [Desulfosarcina sp.]|nr:zinc ABC transporter substrate-binding protein [Desulfobacterales bacterium]
MIYRTIIFIVFTICFVQSGFAADPVSTFVSIGPQKYFVQQIGKELVDVQIMVPPGASPATYEPKPRQMAALSKAQIYFAVGVPFEKAWLKKIAAANPKMEVVQTDHGIEKIPMAAHHRHGDDEGHHRERGVLDPHIWLSPPLVKIQARTTLNALQKIDPAHRSIYETNYHQFMTTIDKLDDDLKTIFSGRRGLQFMVFHPAWGYFAQAYGLKQAPIEIEGKAPKPAQLQALIEQARAKGVKVIFVQPQFSTKNAALIAKEIGGRVALANPLAEDWLTNLRDVADQFKAALQ